MPHDVFISYASEDRSLADEICTTLESAGITCWIAHRDNEPGRYFAGSIVDAIEQTRLVLLIWTEYSNESGHVLKELNSAAAKKKTILPLKLFPGEPSKDMEYYIGTEHWLEASQPIKQHLPRLISSIQSLLQIPIPPEPPSSPPSQGVLQLLKHFLASPRLTITITIGSFLLVFGIIGASLAGGVLGAPQAALLATRTSSPTETHTPLPTSTFTPTLQPSPTNTMSPTAKPTSTIPTPTPTPGIGSTRISEKDGMAQMFVPAGEFIMGTSDKTAQNDERPQNIVFLDAFWMDKTEVTNKMYNKCAQAGICQIPTTIDSVTRKNYFNDIQYANYPVIFVTWSQANFYCEWAGRQLPTEAEWEKAARSTDGRIYPWGDNTPNNKLLNFYNFIGDTNEVGKYPQGASPYGILDMAGNVWEWVADWYSPNYYQEMLKNNPSGPADGQERVIRGGAWEHKAFYVRTTMRMDYNPNRQLGTIGFRCVQSE